MQVTLMLVGMVLSFVVGMFFQAYKTSPTPELVQGEYDTSSKLILERFEGLPVSIVTDKLTGCEYVYTQSGGITPRMYSDGIQVCGQHTYPNGEH